VTSSSPASDVRDLVQLGREHPGFQDQAYRARRNAIARIALEHQFGDPVPPAPYTDAEQGVWRTIRRLLDAIQEDTVCSELLHMQKVFPLDKERIPQLRDLNVRLESRTGFTMQPVMGLVTARTFVEHLARPVFLSTQYIRHHSRPLYTPEPDVVHELVGHAAAIAHPRIAAANRRMGAAALTATDSEMERLERVYWYVLEFGVVEQRGEVRAFGAGLLSSAGELEQMRFEPELRSWDLDTIADTDYDPTLMQPWLFVAPSFDRLISDLIEWVDQGGWRDGAPRWRSVSGSSQPSPPRS
jgi:phenylalanine-4-hydroxylase